MVGLAVAVMAAGCISSPTEPQQAVTEPTSVMITPEQLTTTGGTLEQFSTEVLDAEGQPISGTTVTWKTNNRSVAIVDTDGYVWSFTEGTATATADFPGKGRGSSNGNAYGHSKKDATVSVTQVAPERPGRVTDLGVTSTTLSSATLSFTEVDDGTGSPADYLVRFQVSPVDWGTATDVGSGTCSTPVQGSGVGATRTCTVSNLVPSTDYQFQLVAYRGSYPSDMVYGDLSNVASGSTPAEPEPTQQPIAPGGSGEYRNEPAGLEPIAESDFDCRPGQGCESVGMWRESNDPWKQGNMAVVADASGPASPGSALRLRFPADMRDGISPVRFDAWGPEINYGGVYDYKEIYVTYWLKIEGSNYENETVGTKTHYIAYGSTIRQNHSAPFLDGTFSDQSVMTQMTYAPYVYEMEDDGSDAGGGAVRRTPNVTNYSKKLQVGQWTQVEVYYRINDIGPTQDNGVMKVWIDGTLTHSETGIRYRSDQNPKGFYNIQFTPVYGGNVGDVRTRDDYWRLDHFYISGRR